MGGHRREASRAVPREVGARVPALLGQDAEAELFELLDYVQRQSPRNAKLIADRISGKIDRIRQHPRLVGHLDPDAPMMPGGAEARMANVSGYTIRYVYPFKVEGGSCTLVVSIRRGVRAALAKPEYVLRWLEERTRRGL